MNEHETTQEEVIEDDIINTESDNDSSNDQEGETDDQNGGAKKFPKTYKGKKEEDYTTEDWKNRAMNSEFAIEKNKKGITKPQANKSLKQTPGVEDRLSQIELTEQKRSFGYQNQLSPDETDLVFKYTENPTRETLNDPFIQGGLERIRRDKRIADNTPTGSGSNSHSYFKQDRSKMSASERKQSFQKMMQSKTQK